MRMLSFMNQKNISTHRNNKHLSPTQHYYGSYMKESVLMTFMGTSRKGSISVEASLVTPLFVFFIVTMMSLLLMIKDQSVYTQKMNEKALLEWECSALNGNDNLIILREAYTLTPVIGFFPGLSVSVEDEIMLHSFTGYTGNAERSNDRDEEEYVYVTETGTKYHVNPDCSHINICPKTIDAGDLNSLRNNDGCRYQKCHVCHPQKSGILFVTDYGDSYHCDSNCSALKRTVRMIPLKEALADGYTPCSKCS